MASAWSEPESECPLCAATEQGNMAATSAVKVEVDGSETLSRQDSPTSPCPPSPLYGTEGSTSPTPGRQSSASTSSVTTPLYESQTMPELNDTATRVRSKLARTMSRDLSQQGRQALEAMQEEEDIEKDILKEDEEKDAEEVVESRRPSPKNLAMFNARSFTGSTTTLGSLGSTFSSRVRASCINHDYDVDPCPFNLGSVGVVYQATAKCNPKQPLAIKMVPMANMEAGEEDVAHLVVSQRLTHPNIVTLLDVVIDSNVAKCFFVMEFYAGFDLQYLISVAKEERQNTSDGSRQFQEKTMARFIYEMLSGIAYCHRKRICHRDIRPENYILKYWPQSIRAPKAPLKLIDFGLATQFEPGIPMQSSVGVIYQAAPQVLRQCYSEKCDIWSIGITFYRLACLGTPFWHSDKQDLYRLIENGPNVGESFIKHQEHWDLLKGKYDVSGMQRLLKELLIADEDSRPCAEDILYSDYWLTKRSRAKEASSIKCCCTVF